MVGVAGTGRLAVVLVVLLWAGGPAIAPKAAQLTKVTRSPAIKAAPSRPPSTTRRLVSVGRITGDISPKSVVASGTGLVFAQNMIYRHSVTVYDSHLSLVATIPDTVRLSDFGFPGHDSLVHGGPVEAAVAPGARKVYVSNYSMYGPGFAHPGDDVCSPSSRFDSSYVYRIDVATFRIDQVIAVGAVPKFLAVSPDGRWLLVSNWCSYNLSVVDTETGREVRRLPLGAYPRGIVVDPSSRIAYVAVMGAGGIAKVSLPDLHVGWIWGVGGGPRHVVMDPAGRRLYVTLNSDNQVAAIDVAAGRVVARVHTGSAPRSMTIAPDGKSLYIVNYTSHTLSKLASADLHVLQTVETCTHPIGVTYDARTNRVWVACYAGVIVVYSDR